jgi:hypothetical protein
LRLELRTIDNLNNINKKNIKIINKMTSKMVKKKTWNKPICIKALMLKGETKEKQHKKTQLNWVNS